MDIVVFYGIYIGAALLFTTSVVLAVGGVLHAGARRPEGFLIYFFAPLILVIMLDPLVSGRNLEFGLANAAAAAASGESSSGLVKWIQLGVSRFLLAASIVRLAALAFKPRQPDRPIALMTTFGAYWTATVALPAAFGARPVITHEYFYWLLIGMAGLTTTENGARTAIRVARNALLVFGLAGLAVLAVKRSVVLEPYMSGLIKAFPWRYSGLAVGPNQMGPISLLFMICLSCFPFERRWLRILAWTVAWISFILAQSKTTWLAALVCFSVIWVIRGRGKLAHLLATRQHRLATQVFLGLLIVAILAVVFVLGSGILESRLQRFFATRAGADMLRLTGRNEIWAVAWDTFIRYPWFGYGPTIWDPYFRYQIGMNVFHAHNQFLNVLASSGVVGAFAFLGFMGALVARLWKRLSAFNGFASALFTMIMLRCISEVPWTLHSFASEALAPMLLIVALAGAPVSKPVHQRELGEPNEPR